MKLRYSMMAAIFLSALVLSIPARARQQDEELERQIEEINMTTSTNAGRQEIVQQMKTAYHVDDRTIDSLRAQHMGYGEIMTVFSMAQWMNGGVTTANINKIIDMRRSIPKAGWKQIAERMKVSMKDLKTSLQVARLLPARPTQAAAQRVIDGIEQKHASVPPRSNPNRINIFEADPQAAMTGHGPVAGTGHGPATTAGHGP